MYKGWAPEHEAVMAAIRVLRGLVLGCWCAPRACHGDVQLRWANE